MVGIGKKLVERHFDLARQIDQIAAGALVLYALQVFLGGLADYVQNVIQLIQIVFAREQRLVIEHLGQNATHTPHLSKPMTANINI